MSDKTAPHHHQYYQYGSGSEEFVPGTYKKVWFWESPTTLPYSRNFHAVWEKAFPAREKISQAHLPHFIEHAIPITEEEYNRRQKNKADIQAEDDRLEYMWDRNPWSYQDDD